jgi:hypothetical protein
VNRTSHREVTALAFDLLAGMDGVPFNLAPERDAVADSARDVDIRPDLELVRVKGFLLPWAKDDPHEDEWYIPRTFEDVPSKQIDIDTEFFDMLPVLHWTTLNHFIDVRKGEGIFDDYDGYSFERGSASGGQHQVLPSMGNVGLDSAISAFLKNMYVHAPGHRWYRGCSPSIDRYSNHAEVGTYDSVEAEAEKRFPTVGWFPWRRMGFPYSVFMPVDNMARYWYRRYGTEGDAVALGYVVHAIQDASVPQHAAGCIGNFHYQYENDLEGKVSTWAGEPSFKQEVVALLGQYIQDDPAPPMRLDRTEHDRTPCINWSVDMLVTWLALNAYKEFHETYGDFGSGYTPDDASMRGLTEKAVAVSCLALLKADRENPVP